MPQGIPTPLVWPLFVIVPIRGQNALYFGGILVSFIEGQKWPFLMAEYNSLQYNCDNREKPDFPIPTNPIVSLYKKYGIIFGV
jgi:hypothetical protein